MTDIELDMLLTFRWPKVVRRTMADENATDFAKGFCLSITKHGKRKGWRPSPKQWAVMQRMLAELTLEHEPDIEVIER